MSDDMEALLTEFDLKRVRPTRVSAVGAEDEFEVGQVIEYRVAAWTQAGSLYEVTYVGADGVVFRPLRWHERALFYARRPRRAWARVVDRMRRTFRPFRPFRP